MSVNPAQLIIYGVQYMSGNNGSPYGGPADLTTLISFSDMSIASTVDYMSSSSLDTGVMMLVSGRDIMGNIQTPAPITLTGTTKVLGTQGFAELLAGISSGATANKFLANPGGNVAVGDLAIMNHTLIITNNLAQSASNGGGILAPTITLQAGDGAAVNIGMVFHALSGTGASQIRQVISISGDTIGVNRTWDVVPDHTTRYEIATGMVFPNAPNQISCVQRPFINISSAASGGGNRNYYEVGVVLNTNPGSAMQFSELMKLTDPDGYSAIRLNIAPSTILNDTSVLANRLTAPTSNVGTFTSNAAPISISLAQQTIPSNSAAQAQKFYMNANVAANVSTINTSFILEAYGSTFI